MDSPLRVMLDVEAGEEPLERAPSSVGDQINQAYLVGRFWVVWTIFNGAVKF